MSAYTTVFTTTIREFFVYRLNFILWRLRTFVNLAVTYFLWSAVFEHQNRFGTYEKSEFLAYILLASFISALVLGTRTVEIAGDINNGSIMNILTKPIGFFRYHFARDLADKVLNISFALIEITILYLLFPFQLSNITFIPFAVLFLINGILLSFCVSLLLSFIAFWTTEIWAPRFLFFVIVAFVSGSYFPLDLLPRPLYALLLTTPFPYLYYLPTKAFLGKVDSQVYMEFVFSCLWVIAVIIVTRFVWKKGNKSYSFWGR